MTDRSANLTLEAARLAARKIYNDQSSVAEPFQIFRWLQQNDPATDIGGVVMLTRFEDVVGGYRDQRLSRAEGARLESGAHDVAGSIDEEVEIAHQAWVNMLINLDEPAHRRVRKILEIAFKPTRVAAWQPRVQAIADELVASVSGLKTFDFRQQIAFPLPERIICELMGVPFEDHSLWSAWSDVVVRNTNRTDLSADESAEILAAHRNFYIYFKELVDRSKRDPGEDLVSVLARAECEGEQLSELEMLGSLQMLIEAGHETTANLVCNGMHALLTHPDQYDLLRANPELVPSAVEEMLRFCSPASRSLTRVATEDVHIAGAVIPRGCPVMMQLNAANRDASVFADPDVFDITRSENRHVAFAAGPHFCLGNQLARQEAQAIFRGVATKLPRLVLARDPAVRKSNVISLNELMVRPS